MTGLGRIDPESERVQQGMPRRRYLDDTNVVERGHRGIKLRVAPRDGELHVTDPVRVMAGRDVHGAPDRGH